MEEMEDEEDEKLIKNYIENNKADWLIVTLLVTEGAYNNDIDFVKNLF